MSNPFRYFNTSPEVIRVVMTMYVRRRDDWSDESAGGRGALKCWSHNACKGGRKPPKEPFQPFSETLRASQIRGNT
jgi:hypothetical protein